MKKILLIILVLASRVFPGSATVSWDAPTTNQNGTPLTDLSGYKIYYGQNSGNYDLQAWVGNVTSFRLSGLEEDKQYFFAVTAMDFSGNESGFSNEVSTTIKQDTTGGGVVDNRPPSAWRVVFWNGGLPLEKTVLEIVAHGNETQNADGWTIWGHGNGAESGLYILNPDLLTVRISFDAKIIGKGSCLKQRFIRIEPENTVWGIETDWSKIEFTSESARIFINYFDDCWVPETAADANLRIENIKIFR